MKRPFLKAAIAAVGFVMAGSVGVMGDVLYQNTSTYLGYNLTNFPNLQQVGEQVWQNPLLPAEYLTNFSFVYGSPVNEPWGVTVDVRLYANDGTVVNGYAAPGTLLYNSGWLAIPNPLNYTVGSSSALTMDFGLSDLQFPTGVGGSPLDSNLVLPMDFTFTVTFSGLTGDQTVDLPVFDPPSVGTNYGDYWFDLSGNWELLTNSSGAQIAFNSEFQGQPSPTPEPTVLCLGAFGAAMLTVMARRRQQRG